MYRSDDLGQNRKRLEKPDNLLLPLRKAHEFTRGLLYWIPVGSFPISEGQKPWFGEFLKQFSGVMKQDHGLRGELFLLATAAQEAPLMDLFQRSAREFCPIVGLGKKPGVRPQTATLADIDDVREGRKKFKLDDYAPDLLYWFLDRDHERIRSALFGFGAMSMIFLKPDPATQPPKIPMIRAFREDPNLKNVDRQLEQVYAMQDGFLKNSLKLFAADVADDSRFRDVPFILPVLSSTDLFSASPQQLEQWFSLFDVYVAESKKDEGIVIASRLEIEAAILGVLDSMRTAGLQYNV